MKPAEFLVESFDVKFTRYLDPNGELIAPLPKSVREPETIKGLYRDGRAVTLRRGHSCS